MINPELIPVTKWLQAAAKHGYGCSGDGGKVWVLPETFPSVFGFASDNDNLNLYCQKSELDWLLPAGNCIANPLGNDESELTFWFLEKVAFVLPVPVPPSFAHVALYVYPDIMSAPAKIFPVHRVDDKRCSWPTAAPRFHFIP